MLSRVAEATYWASRYIERAENTARLVRVNYHLLLDSPKGVSPGWQPLIQILGLETQFNKQFKAANERNVVRCLIGDLNNPNSIVSCLKSARENYRTIREIVPRSGWEKLNELFLFAKENAQSGITQRGRDDFLEGIISGSELINGLLSANMYRDEAWHFTRIGRNLERADMTTRIIDVRSVDMLEADDAYESRTIESVEWISILKSLSSYYNYRREVQVRVSKTPVLEFLFQDQQLPRSVLHCLFLVGQSVSQLANNEQPLNTLEQLQNRISRQNFEKLDQEKLHRFIDAIQLGIIGFHSSLQKQYFLPS